MSDKVREQFEAWWVAEYESHTYQHDDAHNMAWEGWLASRAATLEEAAKVVETNVLLPGSHGPLMDVGRALAIKASAKAIRALAGSGA